MHEARAAAIILAWHTQAALMKQLRGAREQTGDKRSAHHGPHTWLLSSQLLACQHTCSSQQCYPRPEPGRKLCRRSCLGCSPSQQIQPAASTMLLCFIRQVRRRHNGLPQPACLLAARTRLEHTLACSPQRRSTTRRHPYTWTKRQVLVCQRL